MNEQVVRMSVCVCVHKNKWAKSTDYFLVCSYSFSRFVVCLIYILGAVYMYKYKLCVACEEQQKRNQPRSILSVENVRERPFYGMNINIHWMERLVLIIFFLRPLSSLTLHTLSKNAINKQCAPKNAFHSHTKREKWNYAISVSADYFALHAL